jgi:hypothetical protein
MVGNAQMRLDCPATLTHSMHFCLFQVEARIYRSQSDGRSNGKNPLSAYPGQNHIPFHHL